jgi:ribonucleoside-diphosphate reductase alpha chain
MQEFLNEIIENIWQDRYKKNNETLDGNYRRVAKYCSTNEEDNKKFYSIMKNKEFFPAGRTMSNSGIGRDLTMNNCFVAPQIKDDLTDIFDKVKLGARTHQRGGGIGYDFSQLRPKGSPTSNDAIASGAISFMDVFNAQTDTILQGNRRGANMGIMNIYSIDIEDFINAKSTDNKRLEHFNLSVMVDNDFIKAVNNDENIFLHFPVYDANGRILKDESKWIYKKEVKAKYLWDLIIKKAYDNGEPGIFFYDNLNNDNNIWYIENIVATNPCFTGDMKLLTADGYKTFESICNTDVKIVNKDGNITNGKVWCSGTKDTIQLTLSNKKKIKCTPDHIFMLADGTECEAQNLLNQRIKSFKNKTTEHDNLYIKLGFIQGDGSLSRIKSQYHQGLEVFIGENDDDIKKLFKDDIENVMPSNSKPFSYYINGYNQILINLMFDGSPLPQRVFPLTYNTWSKKQKLSFLMGCYSANGSIINHHRIAYKTTSKVFANQLKIALKQFDIDSYITTNKSKNVVFKNGEYTCKESYDVNIQKLLDVIRFFEQIGFYQNYKMENLQKLIDEKSPKVISIKKNSKEKVYDFTEPETHWGIVEDVIVHNCSEYVAGTLYGDNPITLEPINSDEYGGACNLGSLMLFTYVKKPFTKDAYVDFDEVKNATYTAVRFLDNIIDINNFPDVIYKNYQEAFRTIGLGDTGMANMLTMLNLKYNSKEAREFIDKLKNFIAFNAYMASIELAKEKGSFPFLDKEKFIQSGFIQKHAAKYPEWEEVIDGIRKYGIRNAKLLSTAPTGTLSIVFGNNCSSGVEPIFDLEYERKVKVGGQSEDNIKIVKMQDYSYYLWKNTTKDNIVKEDVFVTALNISVEDHLEMLKVVAFHTDMSVSKTINIPEDYSFEKTKDIYLKVWEYGIKGCTIFRPNELRQGIITKETKKESTKSQLGRGDIISTSDDLMGFKKTITNGCGKFYIHTDFDESTGEPFETFIDIGSSGGCERNLQFISRLISIALRSGVPIEEIIDQAKSIKPCNAYTNRTIIKKDTSRGSSCPSAIGFALEEMNNKIKDYCCAEFDDENELINYDTSIKYPCPECGEELSFEGGCNCCKSCGYSKCS